MNRKYVQFFVDQVIFMTKERSVHSDYWPQTGPNQVKLVELINSDKNWYNSDKTDLIVTRTGPILTFVVSGQVVKIFLVF